LNFLAAWAISSSRLGFSGKCRTFLVTIQRSPLAFANPATNGSIQPGKILQRKALDLLDQEEALFLMREEDLRYVVGG